MSPRGAAADADAIPYRPNHGVFVTAQQAIEGPALEDTRSGADEVHIPDLLGVVHWN